MIHVSLSFFHVYASRATSIAFSLCRVSDLPPFFALIELNLNLGWSFFYRICTCSIIGLFCIIHYYPQEKAKTVNNLVLTHTHYMQTDGQDAPSPSSPCHIPFSFIPTCLFEIYTYQAPRSRRPSRTVMNFPPYHPLRMTTNPPTIAAPM